MQNPGTQEKVDPIASRDRCRWDPIFRPPAMLHLCLWVVASNNMDIKSYQRNRSCFTILPLPNLKLAELRSKPLGKERKVSRHQVVQDHSRLVYQDHLCLII